jgi:long-chain acyl-CoA synthetase
MAVADTVAGNARDSADTFPKLLIRNAVKFADKPAMRHKDLGIWRSWSWAQMLDEVRALSVGLMEIGVKRGDKIAIIGKNKPRLYWAMCAAQALGAVPVPIYNDSVADEMAYVLEHAEATLAVAEDQEQVDKLASIAGRLTHLQTVVYDEPRGLRDYDHGKMKWIDEVQKLGRDRLASDPATLGRWQAEVDKGSGADLSIILYTSGTTGRPKGVMLTNDNVVISADNGNRFDGLNENDSVIAYLPVAWVGDHIFSYAQSYMAGYCVCCPEAAETVIEDRREIGTTYAFAPPRIYENLITLTMVRMADAGWLKRKMFEFFIGHARKWGEKILNKESVPLHARAARRAPALWDRRNSRLRSAEKPVRHFQGAGRVYGGRGDRAGNLPLLSRARHESEAALWPDRSLGLHHGPAGWRDLRRHRRQAELRRRHQGR